ncbi:MAG TPA: hypothetical protein VGL65_11105 [Gemmatimonadales bacterium]
MTSVLVINLSGSNTNTALGTPAEADFLAGGLVADGPTVTIMANGPYSVGVKGHTSTFAYSGPALTNPNKLASDLTWAPGTGAAPGTCAAVPTYGNNMGSSSKLMSGSVGAPAISASAPSQQICYRTLWTFASSPPGTYMLMVDFTLSEP